MMEGIVKKSFSYLKLVLVALISLSVINCATDFQSNLETAKFELDKGNYTSAINAGVSAVAADPTSIEAIRILASAYFARSGLDFFDLAEGLVDLENSTETNFKAVANILPSSANLDDLRSAITTLETLGGVDRASISDEDLADAVFDLGIMQAVEHFAIGVYNSNYFSTLDVSQLDSDDSAIVLNDLIDFDGRLIASGVDDTSSSGQFISEIRQTYCILEPLSAGDGFTLSEYRALVACQLSDSPSTLDTTAIDAGIANCAALDPSNATQACLDGDTSL